MVTAPAVPEYATCKLPMSYHVAPIISTPALLPTNIKELLQLTSFTVLPDAD
jgi:hypothetical protein